MIMKTLTWLAVTAAFVGCSHGQSVKVPEWKVTVKVIDEENQPVTNATVKVWYHVPPPSGQSIAMTNKTGLTDGNGVFFASEQSKSVELAIEALKNGHYAAGKSYELGPSYQYDPVKWNPTITVVLKKMVNPIPMYAKRIRELPPVISKPVGYDLEVGDWVSPYGKGAKIDFVFTAERNKRAEDDWDYKLVVSFPNSGDGIQEFRVPDVEKGSGLRSLHEGPGTGYQPQWIQTDGRKPGKPAATDRDDNRNYFFRVRTVLDERGNVKSALYGKIYGDFMRFTYYLNPTPNDRNVEFDPKQNLIKNLKPTERVDAP
jgi:hypothetical protein